MWGIVTAFAICGISVQLQTAHIKEEREKLLVVLNELQNINLDLKESVRALPEDVRKNDPTITMISSRLEKEFTKILDMCKFMVLK